MVELDKPSVVGSIPTHGNGSVRNYEMRNFEWIVSLGVINPKRLGQSQKNDNIRCSDHYKQNSLISLNGRAGNKRPVVGSSPTHRERFFKQRI